jgi:hypothetical protein
MLNAKTDQDGKAKKQKTYKKREGKTYGRTETTREGFIM